MKSLILLLMATALSNTRLVIKSPAFAANDFIPSKYTCTGENINPELTIDEVPPGTRTLALIVDDPDAPNGTFDHWVMWNIPPADRIRENSAPGVQGKNGKKETGYTGPCPPNGTHHYHFKIYALDISLDLDRNSDKKALLAAMNKHILASGELVGVFKK